MGNAAGLRMYIVALGWFVVSVMMRVAEDEAKETRFPTLIRMGFSSVESVTDIARELRETV
jgi:hypothetical protein